MSVRAFAPLHDRRQEIWSPEDRDQFGSLARLLNERRIAAALRCAQPHCPSPSLTAITTATCVRLRCGCTDRLLAEPGRAHAH